MVDKLQVMKKDGTSYIEVGYLGREGIVVNGTAASPCPGNRDWVMIDGDVVSIEKVVAPRREQVGWMLKPELAAVVHDIPECLPIDALLAGDDDEPIGDHAELYVGKFEDIPQSSEPIEFEVIDLECEPVEMPDYVKVDFPASLKFRRCVQHKYPCRIAMPDVFQLVARAVVDEANKHKGLYSLNDCRNIGILGVDAVLEIEPRIERNDVGTGRRPKWRNVTVRSARKKVLSIVGQYRGGSDGEQVVGLEAENYSALKEKLDKYIKSFVDRIDPRRWKVCPHCNGEGLVLGAVESNVETAK